MPYLYKWFHVMSLIQSIVKGSHLKQEPPKWEKKTQLSLFLQNHKPAEETRMVELWPSTTDDNFHKIQLPEPWVSLHSSNLPASNR